ncbi:Ketoreductase CTB6 [Cladobotryum mycophilum]|uniref:Ketoreductase CTB6 n=1 Tax=Cladobotryum mycophilum TaxID=491253 RepID=A0ABR0STC4_9HYPO
MAGELVLLTGGTGMVGFRTLVLLVEAGYKVRAAVRNQEGFERILSLKPLAPYASQVESIIVPDITATGAYDEAVKGVKYILHIASPLASASPDNNWEKHVIQPAIKGTVGMLESAHKTSGIEKIVITASVLSITTNKAMADGAVVNEQVRFTATEGPFTNGFEAYNASKALALQATEKFIAEKKPSFTVVNIEPTFIFGRDDTVTEAKNIAKGTNGLIIGPLLGRPHPGPMPGSSVHVDDVASLHVWALDPAVKGNQDFLAAARPAKFVWEESFEVVKKHYAKEYAEGLFKFDSVPPLVTLASNIDSSKAENTFKFKFRSYEDQVVSVVDHYLELLGKEQ